MIIAGALAILAAPIDSPNLGATESAHDTVVIEHHVTDTTFERPGPYAVGEVTLMAKVASEGYSTSVEVWYPARATSKKDATYNSGDWFPGGLLRDLNSHPSVRALGVSSSGGVRNAVAAAGRFPLVLFSHGWGGFRDQSTFLTSHLASWGFVVAAPDHPSRDLTEVLGTYLGIAPPTTDPYAAVQDLLATRSTLAALTTGVLAGHVDASRFVVVGHSDGGVTAENLASDETSVSVAQHRHDPLAGFITLAGSSNAGLTPAPTPPYNTVPEEPSIFVDAADDHVVPALYLKETYNALTAPRRFVTLGQSGHLVFADTCATVPTTGVLDAQLVGLGISIPSTYASGISDGCAPPNIAVQTLWPIIDQIIVAGTRAFFGDDVAGAGLTNLTRAFPSLVTTDATGLERTS